MHEDKDLIETAKQLIEQGTEFRVKFSPLADDPSCKIIISNVEIIMTREQLKAVIQEL